VRAIVRTHPLAFCAVPKLPRRAPPRPPHAHRSLTSTQKHQPQNLRATTGRTSTASSSSSARPGLQAPALPGVLPVLPFPPNEALTPGASTTLHLYEARYLALLDAALARPDRCFAHAVIGAGPGVWGGVRMSDAAAAEVETGGAVTEWAAATAGGGPGPPSSIPSPARPPPGGPPPLPLGDGRAALRCACLARITSVEPVQGVGVGALVTVRGEARLELTDLVGTAPFLAATASLALDAPADESAASLAAAGQAVEALM
jgi:Lon protease-like protein